MKWVSEPQRLLHRETMSWKPKKQIIYSNSKHNKILPIIKITPIYNTLKTLKNRINPIGKVKDPWYGS